MIVSAGIKSAYRVILLYRAQYTVLATHYSIECEDRERSNADRSSLNPPEMETLPYGKIKAILRGTWNQIL